MSKVPQSPPCQTCGKLPEMAWLDGRYQPVKCWCYDSISRAVMFKMPIVREMQNAAEKQEPAKCD